MAEDRDEEGKYKEKYNSDQFLDAVSNLNVASTQNVADKIGCSYDLAYHRLNELDDSGKLSYENVGGSFVWYEND